MKAKGKALRAVGAALMDLPRFDSSKPETEAQRKRARDTAQLIIDTCDDPAHLRAVFFHMSNVHRLLFAHMDAKIAAERQEVML